MENYSYQYNIKLGIPRTLRTWISEWNRETIKILISLTVSNPAVTLGPISYLQICSKIGEGKCYEPPTRSGKCFSLYSMGYSSETSLAQAKIYDHLTPRLEHLLSEAYKFKTAHQL